MLTGPRLEVFHPLPWHSLKQLSGIIIRILQTGNRLREVEQLAQITQLVDVELGFRLQVRLHSTTLGGPLLEALPPNERHFLFTFCKKHLLTLLHLLPPDCMCGQKAAPQPTLDFQREPCLLTSVSPSASQPRGSGKANHSLLQLCPQLSCGDAQDAGRVSAFAATASSKLELHPHFFDLGTFTEKTSSPSHQSYPPFNPN